MKAQNQKKKSLKKILVGLFITGIILFLSLSVYLVYSLPSKVTSLIHSELNKYNFGEYQLEAIAVKHNQAVFGPVVFGDVGNSLHLSQVKIRYEMDRLLDGEIEEILIQGAKLHVNRQGKWQLSGIDGILNGLENYKKKNKQTSKSKIPRVSIEASQLIIHHKEHQIILPLSLDVSEKSLTITTNVSGEQEEEFTVSFDLEKKTASLSKDELNFDLSIIRPFLKGSNVKSLAGRVFLEDLEALVSPEKVVCSFQMALKYLSVHGVHEQEKFSFFIEQIKPVKTNQNLLDPEINLAQNIVLTGMELTKGQAALKVDSLIANIRANLKKFKLQSLASDFKITKFQARKEILEISGEEVSGKFTMDHNLSMNSVSMNGAIVTKIPEYGFECKGDISLTKDADVIELKGKNAELSYPSGHLKNGELTLLKTSKELNADLEFAEISLFNHSIEGGFELKVKQTENTLKAKGISKNLKLFDRVNLQSEFSFLESESGLEFINSSSLSSLNKAFSGKLKSKLSIPDKSSQDLYKDPLNQVFNLEVDLQELMVGEINFEPLNLEASGTFNKSKFSVKNVSLNQFPWLKISGFSGDIDLAEKQAEMQIESLLDISGLHPDLSSSKVPFKFHLKASDLSDEICFDIKSEIPYTKVNLKGNENSLSTNLSLNQNLEININSNDLLKSKFNLDQSFKVIDLEFNSPQISLKGLDISLNTKMDESSKLSEYAELSSSGNLDFKVGEILAENFSLKGFSSKFPFDWSLRRGFEKTKNLMSFESVNFDKYELNNIELIELVEGYEFFLDQPIKLAESLSVFVNQKCGWKISENVLNDQATPLMFYIENFGKPNFGFYLDTAVKLEPIEVSKLIDFSQINFENEVKLDGELSAIGRLNLDESGFASSGNLKLHDLNFYAKTEDEREFFATGINTDLKLSSLQDIKSEDDQLLRISTFNGPGLGFTDTRVKFKIYSKDKLKVNRILTNWCDGLIETSDLTINTKKPDFDCTVHASKVSIEKVLELVKGVECEATGSLYGRLNLKVRNGKVIDQDGFLMSEPATDMTMKLSPDNVIYQSIQVPIARKLMENLDVEYVKMLFIGGDLDKQKTKISIKGQSAVGDPPNPLDLSINLNGPVFYYLQMPLNEEGLRTLLEDMKEK